jgi:polar amino acid transport system permease protein
MAVAQAAVQAPIVDAIAQAQRSARRDFLWKFSLTWAVIIAALGLVIYATGNADPAFTLEWGPFILGGVGITIGVCIASIFLATILAVLGALGRLSTNPFINGVASLYVSLVRGTPLIVQIYFIFFALPLLGVVLDPIPAGILALSFNYGAYMTEIFRAGIQAVPKGQREAAQALGMPDRLIMRRVVLPQAVRIVTPAIGNDFVSMIKDSSLVSLLGLQELLWRANTVGRSNQQIIQALLIAALVYWALTIIFSYFQARLEKRMAKGDR